jgi:hypothetical protein
MCMALGVQKGQDPRGMYSEPGPLVGLYGAAVCTAREEFVALWHPQNPIVRNPQ